MRSLAAYVVAFSCVASCRAFALEKTGDADFVLSRIRVEGNKIFKDGPVKNLVGLEKGERYEEYNFDYLLDAGLAAVEGAYYGEGFESVQVGFELAESKKGKRELNILVEE